MGVTDVIPKIEGFQPIPNAVMIPFMEVQSAALAYGFGLNYEYSKRKIRSMSNEQFNSTTPEDIEEMQARHTAVLLEGFIKRVPQVMPAQAQIFKQYVEIEKLKVLQNVELAKWIATNAPSIITTGKPAETDIRQTPTTNFPPATTSSNAASISQDASGKVTTTPKTVTIKLLESGNRIALYTKTIPQWQSELIRLRKLLNTMNAGTLTASSRITMERIGKNVFIIQQTINPLTNSFN